jgi:serine/threonine protein kinase/DNA-directed RNA polymerase specialized sigma subunit
VTLHVRDKFGPFEIESAIGEGGLGEVWKARDTATGRPVALRLLPSAPPGDPSRFARFERDVRVLSWLNHPNVATVYGLLDAGTSRVLASEWVDGPSLAERIAQGPMPLEQALVIAAQIADALGAAHDHGVVHADVKPSNIKLCADDTVKVLDFALAEVFEPEPTSDSLDSIPSSTARLMGVITGTSAYMSPEQVQGARADTRSDVWAFGCVLYEMLTGRLAFAADDLTETMALVISGEPEWTLMPVTTPSLITRIVRKCLSKDVSVRYRDLTNLSASIREAIDQEDAFEAFIRQSAIDRIAAAPRTSSPGDYGARDRIREDDDDSYISGDALARYREALERLTEEERNKIRQRLEEQFRDDDPILLLPSAGATGTAVMRSLRRLIARIRGRKSESLRDESEPPEAADDTLKRYRRALAALKERERRLIILRIEEGAPYEEIAKRCELSSAAAARMAVARAIKRLAEQPDKDGADRMVSDTQAGAGADFDALIEQQLPALRRWVAGIPSRLGVNPGDLLQSVLLDIKRLGFTPRHERAFEEYIRRAVLNRVRDEVRRQRRRGGEPLAGEQLDASPLERALLEEQSHRPSRRPSTDVIRTIRRLMTYLTRKKRGPDVN